MASTITAPMGSNRDEFVIIRKTVKAIDWLERPHADASSSAIANVQAAE